MRLLAIDPGVKALGWAYFFKEKLVDCGLLRAKDVQDMVDELWMLEVPHIETLVIERPQVYAAAKADPNDLIGLALVAGAAAGVFTNADSTIHFPHPAKWKGQTPKEIHHERIMRALSMLEQEAFAEARVFPAAKIPASLRHNVLDAVGMGLWQLGRLR